MWLRALAVAGLALAGGCGGDPLDRLADGGRGRVADALSGEVLLLEDGRTVRLAGVDAPDPAAEAELERLVDGREVALLHGGAREDGYGRTVAHVRLLRGRRWLQGELLDRGSARVRTSSEDASMAREMLRREARARAQGRGIWAHPGYGVRLPQEVGVAGGFMVVEGRVERAERARDSVYLEFAARRGGFAVQAPRRAVRDFEAAGVGLEALPGRLVRVRGFVRASSSGPLMRVDHPEQIELLRER